MGDYNMLNNVPFNVNVPEFQPERSSPIFPQITRKYPCIEDVVTHGDDPARFNTLTWKIQQPDRSMVWTSVKLVLPLKMQAYRQKTQNANMPNVGALLNMNVADKLPACNIAVAESPMSAFRQSSMTINGRIFSEVNDFRKILDTCYRGTGPSSYGDNHSLKPVVSRDIKGQSTQIAQVYVNTAAAGLAPVHAPVQNAAGLNEYIQVEDVQGRSLDSAFSLLEHNGPFLERARKFQDELSFDGKSWQGLITNYLELGPFQARARKGNTAVPYIRDFHLRLNYDTNPCRFDSKVGTDMDDVIPVSSCRVIPSKLFEFGTIPNLKHHGETVMKTNNFISAMVLQYTEKPYLEITYTRFIEAQKPYYNLRCFEHQYEQSNPFTLAPPLDRISPTAVQRVTSRLLSYPTKIYVYADLADYEQFPWILGGCRRSCRLKNIHCRVNQRPDIVFNPSQEECYEMFRRHTNSSLEFGAWLKSPIYCFDPVDLGQSDMFANDARLTLMEWDAEVSLTPLQIQEMRDAKTFGSLLASGYDAVPATHWVWQNYPNSVVAEWNSRAKPALGVADNTYWISLIHENQPTDLNTFFIKSDAALVLNKNLTFLDLPRQAGSATLVTPTKEVFKPTTTTLTLQAWRGMIWAQMDPGTGNIVGDKLFYVPQSHYFRAHPNHATCIIPWSALTTTVVNHAGGDDTYTYNISAPYRATWFTAPYGINLLNITGKELNPIPSRMAGYGSTISTPGPYAFVTDRYGIHNRNQNNSQAWQAASVGWASASGNFPIINQTNTTHKWIMLAPDSSVHQGAGPDGMLMKWRTTNTNQTGQVVNTKSDFLGGGQHVLACRGAMVRNTYMDNIVANANMALLGANNWANLGPRIALQDFEDPAGTNFDYTMKVLYEYGNSQYQFSQDGAPTKVLPNLVPVGPSAGIPMLQ